MQLLPILVAILLGMCALTFVLYPIYERMRQDGSGQGDREGRKSGGLLSAYYTGNVNHDRSIPGARVYPPLLTPALEDSHAEREQTARTALQEVELDFQLGNLAETDYRSLRERYMRRALLAMKSRHNREQELDEAIEEQLRRMRDMDEQAKE